VRRGRDVVCGDLADARDRAEDDVELTGEQVQLRVGDGQPGQLREMRDLIPADLISGTQHVLQDDFSGLLDPRSGAVNQTLGTTINWLQEPGPAQLAIIVITGWHVLGFAVLVVAAGLAGITDDYADAAALDGATRGQITRWITVPLLSPTLVFLLLMSVLLAAQWSFPLIDTLTHGGPAGATTNVYYLLWDYGFHSFDAGLGAAAGVIFFLGFGVIAGLLVWLSEKVTIHDN